MHLVYFAILALFAHLVPAVCFSDSLTIDASFKEVYETNVNPLLSGAARSFARDDRERQLPAAARISSSSVSGAGTLGTHTSDFYSVLNAAAGWASIIGPEAELAVRAELERQQFRNFSELNASTFGTRAVLSKQFSDLHSMRMGFTARRTGYHIDALTGSGFTTTVGARQQPASRFCMDEAFMYERYRAKDDIGYAGFGLALQTGYRMSPALTAALSYGFLRRIFNDGPVTLLHALTLSGAWEPVRHFNIFASFEHQRYESAPSRLHASNSISTFGVGCSY